MIIKSLTMKKIITFLLFIFSLPLRGQEVKESSKIQIEIGFLYHLNDLNEDNYLDNKSPFGLSQERLLTGLDLRFKIPTKLNFLDFVFGTIIERCGEEYQATTDYKLNGGGVFAGISPKLCTKHFGVTSLIAVGVLSYKEYFAFYRDSPLPIVDIYEKKSSSGLGAITTIGAYAKFGPVGIHPQVQAVFSGGGNASFFFYGFVIPLTIQF